MNEPTTADALRMYEQYGKPFDTLRDLFRKLPPLARRDAELALDTILNTHRRLLAESDALAAVRQHNRLLRHRGDALANCAFNLAQRSSLLDERARAVLDESRREWDDAVKVQS